MGPLGFDGSQETMDEKTFQALLLLLWCHRVIWKMGKKEKFKIHWHNFLLIINQICPLGFDLTNEKTSDLRPLHCFLSIFLI